MCDQDRRSMLLSEGLHVGKGEAHGTSKSCFADSLLQLLMCHDVIPNVTLDTTNAEKLWRRDACLADRAHLCNHEDITLHPRLRDHTSAVVQDASAEDNALSYLEHHRHYIAIVKRPVQDEARKGFRIVVHSRFDERVDPFMDVPLLCLVATLQVPHIDVRLYNHTGNGVTGFHYDPVFLCRLRPRGSAPVSKTKQE